MHDFGGRHTEKLKNRHIAGIRTPDLHAGGRRVFITFYVLVIIDSDTKLRAVYRSRG